ncbi:DedA family protein [Acidithiobacillus caldus]|uniref:DedA family protein n=1 Tax=Acidithiobacillus caldus TaxID=33059 RepID=UPI001C06F259|nr:DedA family protein [Acidithiobacillus caldus]MBU2783879.1 DedA family protein [Acidithiobacillus caldus]
MFSWFLAELSRLIATASPILHRYGMWAVFALVFVENLGVVFAPGESVVVAAGFLAAKGVFSVWVVLPLAMLAATLGSGVAYGIGARYGHKVLLRYGRYVGVRQPMVDRVHRFFQRFGPPIVVVGRFVVPLRQLQGYLAGSSEMGFASFVVWSAVGSILWVLAWGGGAFWLARLIPVGG